jgi:hypothetical protein
MKTSDLVDLLARDTAPVSSNAAARRLGAALVIALGGAMMVLLAVLGLNPQLAATAWLPLFWVKIAFVAGVAIAGGLAARRLAIPGARLTGVPLAHAAPLVAIWLIAATILAAAAPGERIPLLLGETWRVCPFNITMLSVPGFFAMLWAMKGLAPTRLRLAGAAAGLFAAGAATLVYTLHCPELAPPFLGTWYVLGMAIPTIAGGVVGPRVLRW